MILYIARHGKAERNANSGFDRDRRLRPRGERQAVFLGQQLSAMAIPPTAVFMSPYARTRQTAQTIADILGLEPMVDERLLCGAPASAGLDLIAEYEALGVTPCLVGHNPQVSELVGILVAGLPASDAGMRTGEMVALSLEGRLPIGSMRLDYRLRLEED